MRRLSTPIKIMLAFLVVGSVIVGTTFVISHMPMIQFISNLGYGEESEKGR